MPNDQVFDFNKSSVSAENLREQYYKDIKRLRISIKKLKGEGDVDKNDILQFADINRIINSYCNPPGQGVFGHKIAQDFLSILVAYESAGFEAGEDVFFLEFLLKVVLEEFNKFVNSLGEGIQIIMRSGD